MSESDPTIRMAMGYDSILDHIHPQEQRYTITKHTLACILYTNYMEVLYLMNDMEGEDFTAFHLLPDTAQEKWVQRADKALQSIARGTMT